MKDSYKWVTVSHLEKSHLKHTEEAYYTLCEIGMDDWIEEDFGNHCKECERLLKEEMEGGK